MLSCTRFVDRLYDEDCRAALEGAGAPPEDVAAHRRECLECRREWEEAAADLQRLPAALVESPPARLSAQLQKAAGTAAPPAPRASVFDVSQALAWAALGAAAAVLVALTPALPAVLANVGPLTWSVLGASTAAGASVARDALSEALG